MTGIGEAALALDERVFAGKIAYAGAGQSPLWLTVVERRNGAERFYLPMMTGKGKAADFPAIVYRLPDGTFRVQLGNLMWIALSPLSALQLEADVAKAAALRLSGDPLGQGWEVATDEGFAPVGYDPSLSQPVLTTSFDGGVSTFAPTLLTPSVADVVKAGRAPGADFTHVRLDGASLPDIDLTGAHFDQGSLVGARLTGCTLTGATFVGADLGGVAFDRARLDGADMTRARLAAPSWGAPLSARKIVLTQCRAAGAILGGPDKLDCAEATLTQGDFTGADLQGWRLPKAQLGRAVLVGATLTGAVLDGADMSEVVALRGVFRQASMRNVKASGANFVRADLSGADLGQAQLGARAFLFQIAAALAKDLDENAYPDAAVLAAFSANGAPLPPQSPITVIARGERWEIKAGGALYALLASDLGIQVFLASADLRPATLSRAVCLNTKAPGAGLSGVDLRGVQWHGSGATLNHADLEGADMSQALCASTDFTQAFLSGCDLSGSVLVQAVFRGCRVGTGASRQPLSLEGAQLQGADFTAASLTAALLVDAGVSLPQGSPLFSLPAADAAKLTPEGLPSLAPVFAEAGYPLGQAPSVDLEKLWLIDNTADPTPTDPRRYRVRMGPTPDDDLDVFNGDTNVFCFSMSSTFASQLSKPNPSKTLIQVFTQNGYGLVAEATIGQQSHWTITADADAPLPRAFGYRLFTVLPGEETLTVLGGTLLRLRDWTQYSEGLAFSATVAIQTALNPTSIGPVGAPMAWVTAGDIDWTHFLMRT